MTSSTTTITQFETDSARYYHRNFVSGLIHGIFFQLSAAFTNIHTMLPAFVTLLTPAMAVGLKAVIYRYKFSTRAIMRLGLVLYNGVYSNALYFNNKH